MFFKLCLFCIDYVFILIVFILLRPFYAIALDEERLWIPSNYEHLYLDLKELAIVVEALDRCETVLRGTLDFDASALPDDPVFRILCRGTNGRTYNEMVTPQKIWTESEMEENKAKKAKALLLVQNEMQTKCDMRLSEDVALFNALQRKQASFLLIKFEHSSFSDDFVVLNPNGVFQMDFDAADMYGVKLEYRAMCYIESGAITKMAIKKREENTSKKISDENVMDK